MSETAPELTPEDDEERVVRRSEVGLALSAAGFGDVHVLSHEAAERALTENRRALIHVIATQDIASIRDLARRVGRDSGNVKRDLDVLAAENVLAFETDGRSKRPYVKPDTVVQEPLVTGATESGPARSAEETAPAGHDR